VDTLKRLLLTALYFTALALAPIGAVHAQVKVTAAAPSSTVQGTVSLDVIVSGSGFDSTSSAQFFVTGTTNPGGITVRKTTFRNSKEVVATIDVADMAVLASFDIQVTLSSGRKGKGTTLFTVQSKTSDPCAVVGLDFPAFTYWRQSGASTRQLFLADATGTCSRSIMVIEQAQAAVFSYPVAGTENVGRIVFPRDGSLNRMDFTVNHADNSIVLGNVIAIMPSLNLGSHQLSPDGTTVYYSTGAGSPEGFASVYKAVIGDPQPPQEIYRSLIAGGGFSRPSVSADGMTLIIEQHSYFPDVNRVVRITLPCIDAVECATVLTQTSTVTSSFWSALNPVDPIVGYSDYLAGSNNCWQVHLMDVTTGTPVYAGTQPRFGTALSWLDNKLLANGYKPPDRRGKCFGSGTVTLIDPATGAETPLVNGFGPDGR
jgi:hypothetical protein